MLRLAPAMEAGKGRQDEEHVMSQQITSGVAVPRPALGSPFMIDGLKHAIELAVQP